MTYFGFDLLIGILVLQGLIADILLLFGAGFLVWLWLDDRKLQKKNKQMVEGEYEGLKQAMFAHIDTMFQEYDNGDGEPAYL